MKKDRQNGLIVIALSKAFKGIHTESIELLREYDITFSQFAVMEALYTKGPLAIQEIIDVVLTTSGNMTVVIRNLEKAKIIKKEINPKDKRSYLISLTSKGEDLIKEIFPKHMEVLSKKMDALSNDEKNNLLKILKKLY